MDNDTLIATSVLILIIGTFALVGFKYAHYQDEQTLCNGYAHRIQQQ